MAQADQAHQIQNGVYELFLTTRSYLAHGEEGLRQQWEARFASLRSLVRDTHATSRMQHRTCRSSRRAPGRWRTSSTRWWP